MIGIGVADCLSLLLLDPTKKIIAAAHAGWKGTAAGIARKVVEAMAADFGSDPADLIAAIGPGIGPCCYEVDETVRVAFKADSIIWEKSAVESAPGKWKLDLVAANRLHLIDSGLSAEKIEAATHCVCCIPELFFSYRRDKGDTGRHLGFIMLKQ
jgi:YfiH family protein